MSLYFPLLTTQLLMLFLSHYVRCMQYDSVVAHR